MSADVNRLWAEVKERNARWSACPRHRFPHRPEGYRLGEKVRCDVCGVEASLVDVGNYVRGYVAAGGDPADVMPDWASETGANGSTGVVRRLATGTAP